MFITGIWYESDTLTLVKSCFNPTTGAQLEKRLNESQHSFEKKI